MRSAALTRFRILMVLAALTAAATVLAACGDEGPETPQGVVNEATLQGIESGNLELRLNVEVRGPRGGRVDVSLSGPFQNLNEEELPELDLSAKADGSIGGERVDFEGGLTLLPNKAFVEYGGSEYEVDPTTFNFVKSALRKQADKATESGDEGSGCQDVVGELQVADFIDGLKEEGSVDIGGVTTTRVSGELDAAGAIEALMDLIEDPACSAQLGAAGQLPSTAVLERAKRKVVEALKRAHVVLYVGDDHIVRRISAEATIEPPRRSARESGAESVTFDFDMTLSGVNEEQTITPPEQAAPLSNLFLRLGINPLELAEALSGEGGLEDLLESLTESSLGGRRGEGGQGGYLSCLKDARTAADIQKCAGLLQ